MGTLRLKDKIVVVKLIQFGHLRIGEVFKHNQLYYIKMTDDCGYDIINHTTKGFSYETIVMDQSAEITFH